MDLTIIIPVLNQRETIGHTLDSIIASPIQPKQIIVVDNESTDGTYQYLEQYIKGHSHMLLLKESFPGAAAARNKGLKYTKTEWVYFFNATDEFDHEYLSMLNRANSDNYEIIASPVTEIAGKKPEQHTFTPSLDPKVHLLSEMLYTQSMTFRTEWLKDIGGWNKECRCLDDWELGLRALLHQPNVLWFTARPFHKVKSQSDASQKTSIVKKYQNIVKTLFIANNEFNASILQPLSVYHKYHLNCLYPHSADLRLPLYFYSCILLGKLKREKNANAKDIKEAEAVLKSFIDETFTVGKWDKIMGWCYTTHAKMGSNSTWTKALAYCKK